MSDDRQAERTPRVPPSNIEAEAAALGAAMIAPEAAATVVEQMSSLDFYSPANKQIFAAVRELVAENQRVDVVMVSELLRRAGALDEVGGIERLSEMVNDTPSVSGALGYIDVVRGHAERRRMILAGSRLVEAGYGNDDPTKALTQIRSDVDGLVSKRVGFGRSSLQWLDPEDVLNGLEPEEPDILVRTDGACLFYAGKMHQLQAEPSAGKSWVAVIGGLQIFDMGGSVLYIDYEDTGRGIMRRCQEAGATITREFLQRFRYVQPEGAIGPDEIADLNRAVEDLAPDLVIIDGVAASMSRCGLSEDVADDVYAWADLLPRPLARTGAAVVMLDHVVKSKEERGRYARGSGAKLAYLDGAAYNVRVRSPFSKNRSGVSELVCDKDRPGGVGAIGETVARVKFEPHAGGERLVVTVDPYTAEFTPHDEWKPTILMEKVSRAVEDAASPMTASTVKSLVHAEKPAHLKEAIARLLAEGFVVNDGRPKALRSLKPFRAAWSNGPGAPVAPPEPTEDPRLFSVPDEPDHLEAERQEALESLWNGIDQHEDPTTEDEET